MPTLIYDGVFAGTTTVNTTPNSAATSTKGAHDAPTVGAANGWIDVPGSSYSVDGSNVLNGISGSFASTFLRRPSAQDAIDQRVVAWVPPGRTGDAESVGVRYQDGSGNYYLAFVTWSSGALNLYKMVGGSPVPLGGSASISPSYNSAHTYRLDLSAPTPSAGVTTVTLNIYDDTAGGGAVGTLSRTDNEASLQGSGGCILIAWGTAPCQFTRAQAYGTASASFAISPNSGTTNTTVSVTATGAGTAWTSGTTFNVTGGSGASISGTAINVGAQTATFNLTIGSSAGTLTINDSTDAATATFTASDPASLIGATLAQSSESTTAIAMTFSGISGGTAPYSTRLYRSSTSGFTPPGGGTAVGSPVAGVSGTLTDASVPSGNVYFYNALTSDHVSVTAVCNERPAALALPTLVLSFIGDSITAGTGTSGTTAVQQVGINLSAMFGYRTVTILNEGVSGTTTTLWLPAGAYLTAAIGRAVSAGVSVISLMLGANDCSNANLISAATYGSNLASIAAAIVATNIKVVLHYPMYIDISVSSGLTSYSHASLNLLIGYQAQIDALVNGTTILAGDKRSFATFADSLSALLDGIHPNNVGHVLLGNLQTPPIARALGLMGAAGGAPAVIRSNSYSYIG